MYEKNPIETTFENKYLTGKHFSSFTHELGSISSQKSLNYIKQKNFISAYVRYPNLPWSNKADVFESLDSKFIHQLKNKECFFVIDASEEGYCPIKSGWFDAFYNTFNLYQIDPKQIIFASSNLKDEENMQLYAEKNSVVPMHAVSWNKFETHADLNLQDNTLLALNYFIEKTKTDFTGEKFFSSLCRKARPHKTLMQFLFWIKCKRHALLSHPSDAELPKIQKHIFPLKLREQIHYYSLEWFNALPLIADYSDFSVNWAIETPFQHLHTGYLFQVVNETWGDEWGSRSKFYSEKSFMAMSCFTPFLINGSVGLNHYLENIGYKLYRDWFDYSFDFEENYQTRCLMISDQIVELCKKLESMSVAEQIDWKFQNKEILIHNYNTMKERRVSIEKHRTILNILEKQVTPTAT